MNAAYRQIVVEHVGPVWYARLRNPRLAVDGLDQLLADLDQLVADGNCRKLVLSLGPEEPECLYSIFLAKLVSIQRRLTAAGGALVLAEASDSVRKIFAACRLDDIFRFEPDRNAAIAALS
jgi:hypothetical protein